MYLSRRFAPSRRAVVHSRFGRERFTEGTRGNIPTTSLNTGRLSCLYTWSFFFFHKSSGRVGKELVWFYLSLPKQLTCLTQYPTNKGDLCFTPSYEPYCQFKIIQYEDLKWIYWLFMFSSDNSCSLWVVVIVTQCSECLENVLLGQHESLSGPCILRR